MRLGNGNRPITPAPCSCLLLEIALATTSSSSCLLLALALATTSSRYPFSWSCAFLVDVAVSLVRGHCRCPSDPGAGGCRGLLPWTTPEGSSWSGHRKPPPGTNLHRGGRGLLPARPPHERDGRGRSPWTRGARMSLWTWPQAKRLFVLCEGAMQSLMLLPSRPPSLSLSLILCATHEPQSNYGNRGKLP